MRKLIAVVSAVAVVAAGFVWLNAASRIGTVASDALGIPFTVGAMNFNPFGGSASLTDVRIHSVPPFQAAHVLRIDRIEASFQTSTLLSDHVVINEVVIKGAEVTVEQRGTSLNFTGMRERFELYVAASDTSQGPRIVVREFRFEEGRGTLITDLGSTGFDISPIVLYDLGSESSGTPVIALASRVLESVMAETLESAGLDLGTLGRLRSWLGR